MQLFRHAGMALFASLLVTACATGPAPDRAVSDEVQEARSAEARGNFSEAAELWLQAATVAAGPDREAFRVRAAEAWLRAGEEQRSTSTLARVNDDRLSGSVLARYALLSAELALVASDLDRAETYLDIAAGEITPDLRPRFRQLQQRAVRMQTNPAGFALSTVATALRSMDHYDTASGVAMLQLLEDVPSSQLENIPEVIGSADRLDGWPRLALAVRRALVSGTDLEQAAGVWASGHPEHVVTESGFVELATAYRSLFALPRRFAVLLPTQGGLAPAGSAIRDGIVSAFLQAQAPVEMRFYATGDEPQTAISAYYAARNEGAEWMIGPLRRESVEALSSLGSLGTPFLMLNTLPEGRQPAVEDLVFSLSLSQELEAEAIARKALESGLSAAMVMFPDNPWGRRVDAAFSAAYTSGGGTITERAAFSPAESDHGVLLTELLQINQSQDRKNRLQATLSIPLSFEATRRDDFDLIFLAAEPEQGRQIRPQLRFYDAGSKPIIAMSRIFSGRKNPDLDFDLNGIIFPSTRWHTQDRPNLVDFSSARDGSMGSLYDLGADAWGLIPWLPLLRKDPDLRYPGRIGALYMDEQGRLRREPIWARFSGGIPKPLNIPGE